MVTNLFLGLGGLILAVLAGRISSAESALIRITVSRADAIAAVIGEDDTEDDAAVDARAQRLRQIARAPLGPLMSVGLALLLCQVGAVVLFLSVGWRLGGVLGGAITTVVGTYGLFVAGAVGRGRALSAPDKSAVQTVPVERAVRPLRFVAEPIRAVVARMAPRSMPDSEVEEQHLIALAGSARAASTTSHEASIRRVEEEVIKRVVALGDTVVGDIMTPRTDVVTLRSGFPVRTGLEVASLHGLSRLPVTAIDGDAEDIIGMVHVKDLILDEIDGNGGRDIDLHLRPVDAVPISQNVFNLQARLQQSRAHLAVVVDEYGGVAGIVTLEDILEELVGEIEDEFDDADPPPEVIDNHRVRVDGRFEVVRLEEQLGRNVPIGDRRTIAGCFFSAFGRVPDIGDAVTFDGVELTVIEMHGRRIKCIELRFDDSLSQPLPDLDEVDV